MIGVIAERLGVGAGFVFVGCAAIWPAIHLRSSVIERYAARRPMTEAALDERAAQALRELSLQVDAALGVPSQDDRTAQWMTGQPAAAPFDPQQALASPAQLLDQLGKVKRLLRDRDVVGKYVARMCWAGPILTALVTLYVAGAALAVVYYAEVRPRWETAGRIGLWTAIGATVCAVTTIAAYAHFVFRFDKVELRARG